jgi:Smg protein
MYLFESYVDSEDEPEPNRNELRDELERAGFGNREIDRALEWLDGLNFADVAPQATSRSAGIRLYDTAELQRFDAAARGYLLHLEQVGILPPDQRELVIDRLLALEYDEIEIEQIKWVVMMVLFSQPGNEQAYAQMEDLVFAEEPGWMH